MLIELKALPPGRYEVTPKVRAHGLSDDNKDPTTEEAVEYWARKKPERVRQLGRNYDIAHRKVLSFGEHVKTTRHKSEASSSDSQVGKRTETARRSPEIPLVKDHDLKSAHDPGKHPDEDHDGGPETTEVEGILDGRRGPWVPPSDMLPDPGPSSKSKTFQAWCTIGLKVHCLGEKVEIGVIRPQDESQTIAQVQAQPQSV